MSRSASDLNQFSTSEARKGHKGGLGYVLLMGGMLAKTMAALGFGGVAMLALKALGASLAALLLSSVVGLKKLGEQGHHESHVHKVVILSALCLLAVAAESSFKECLEQDSISCVQMTLFRKARDFFDQQDISVVDGLSFKKDSVRGARSIPVDTSAIEAANTIESREDALENYVSERAMNFFQERSLNLDMMTVGRAVSQAIPEEVKESMRSMVGEARKKKKKLLKKLAPLLGLVKLKAQGLMLLALVGIAIIAKKALVIGVIALVLAKLGLVKAIIAKVSSKAGGGGGGIADLLGGLGGGSSSSSGAEAVAYQAYAPQTGSDKPVQNDFKHYIDRGQVQPLANGFYKVKPLKYNKMTNFLKIVCIVTFATVVSALPTEDFPETARNAINTENELMDSIYTDCVRKDSVNCVKYKLFSIVDKILDKRDTFAVTEGVTVVKTAKTNEKEGSPRGLNENNSLESMILGRIQNYLQTHTIKVELKGVDVVNAISSTSRALEEVSNSFSSGGSTSEEARGKGKKKAKLLGPLLLAVALKGAALIPLALGAIALIAGKALLIGKIALVLSAIIGLKKLLSQEKHVTYEVVAHPHHTSSHSSSHSDVGGSGYSSDVGSYGSGGGSHGWGRSANAQDIVYSAYKST
ncbi:uncharacterized protein LOC134835322 [Culicoides brevitarsis]|uniref:uncharacterized protein LOC134835322 n=1 Tax=Culicoides brevitarsis TaxID=469753 RepID=UPI00307C960A